MVSMNKERHERHQQDTTSILVSHPRVGVGCIVQRNGKVLLGERKGSHGENLWAPPGGHLEFGELVTHCAARELIEETGLQPISLRLGPWVENTMEHGQKHYITIFVYIDEFLGEPILCEPEKCKGWEWFSWNMLPQLLFEPARSFIEKIQSETNCDHTHL
jgi:8-oxo-dGTP diphosphatase